MNFWFTIFLLFITALFSFSTGLDLAFRLLYLLLFLLITSYFWAKANIKDLRVERKINSNRSQVGDYIEEEFEVISSSRFPKLWIELCDSSDLPNHHAGAVFSIGGNSGRRWEVRTKCLLRGHFCLGSIKISSGDPFGLFRHSLVIPKTDHILVYPATHELPQFEFPSGRLSNEGRIREPSRVVTPNASGIREYVIGDGFGRIHWLSTARKNKFMVKEFDQEPSSETWLLLDLQYAAQAGQGAESTEEYAVSVAASVARRLIEQGRSVGLVGYGQRQEMILPGRGSPQLLKILDSLAVIKADGELEVREAIVSHSVRLRRNSGIIMITASMDERWVEVLQQLVQKGVKASAILLEPSTFGGEGNPLLVASGLIASQIPVYFVRQGSNLGEALNSQMDGGL